jgi:hypothetical protein
MEEQTVSPEYLKGFNEGYMMRKHMPELAAQLGDLNSTSERSVGFLDGQKQFELEIGKENQPDWLKPKSMDDFTPGQGADKDLEIEP